MTATVGHADIAAARDDVEHRGAVAVVTDVLDGLAAAQRGVLVGPPLAALALADAARLDDRDDDLPLRGVAFVVKDNIDVGGVATTAACPGFAYVSRRDAAVVASLRAAGAVVVGKANLDQFATGLVGTRSPYGTPPNTRDADLVPGGSSSGSAVAVALGLVPFALGTDTAGSGRVPAALNGVVGWKPTVGRFVTTGIVPAIRRLDCPSVFARSVADALAVAAAMGPVTRASATAPPTRTVGIVERWPSTVALDPAIDASYRDALVRLATRGLTMRPVDPVPLLDLGRMLYGSALVAERALTAGEAIRRGVDGLDPVVSAVIGAGARYSAEDAYRAEYELADRRAAAEACLAGIDVLALPTIPTAPTLAAVAADPIGVNAALGTFTTFVNLLGRPAVVVPVPGAVPTGLQLIGAASGDDALAAFAATW